MTNMFYLHAAAQSASTAFLAKRNEKGIEKLVEGKWKTLYPCKAGFRDVEIALQANDKFDLKIEIYEDDCGKIVRYDPLIRLVRRRKASTTYHVRRNLRTR
jgi:hypothetical protein